MNIITVKLIGYRLRKYGFRNLAEYYLSKKWEERKKEFKEEMKRSNLVLCSSCGVFNNYLQVHHKTYKSLCDEKLEQLCFFCSFCHNRVHKIANKEGCSIRVATKKLQRSKTQKEKTKRYLQSKKVPFTDSVAIKGIAKTRYSHNCVDLNFYEPTLCKVIKPDGSIEFLQEAKKQKPKRKNKKFYVPENRRKLPTRKKVKLKYTDEEIRNMIFPRRILRSW